MGACMTIAHQHLPCLLEASTPTLTVISAGIAQAARTPIRVPSQSPTSSLWTEIREGLGRIVIAIYVTGTALCASIAHATEFSAQDPKDAEDIDRINSVCGLPAKNLDCIEILSKTTHPKSYTSDTSVAFSSFISGPASSFSGVSSEFIYTTIRLKSSDHIIDLSNSYQINGDPLPTDINTIMLHIGIGYQIEAKGYSAKISAPFTAALLPGSLGLKPESNYLEAKFADISPNTSSAENLININCQTTKNFSEKFACAVPALPSIDQTSFAKIAAAYKKILKEAISTESDSINVCPQILEVFVQKYKDHKNLSTPIRIMASAALIKKMQNLFESKACKSIQPNARVKFSNGGSINDISFDTSAARSSGSVAEYTYARNHYFYPATYCNTDSKEECNRTDSYSSFWISAKDESATSPSILSAVFSAKSKAQAIDIRTFSQLEKQKLSIINKIPSEADLITDPAASLEDLANQMKFIVDINAINPPPTASSKQPQ